MDMSVSVVKNMYQMVDLTVATAETAVTLSFWSVSYTHLDVYKRQDKIFIFDLSEDDEEHEKNLQTIKELNRNLEIKVCAGGNINRFEDIKKIFYTGCLQAVSYTHLDVYKRQGLDIGDDTLTRPAELEILSANEQSFIRVTITEGRFHQVKRMFQAVGKEVVYLKRISMGNLLLDETLKPGDYRELTEEEIRALKNREDSYCSHLTV